MSNSGHIVLLIAWLATLILLFSVTGWPRPKRPVTYWVSSIVVGLVASYLLLSY